MTEPNSYPVSVAALTRIVAGDRGRNVDLLFAPHTVCRWQLTTRDSIRVIVDGGLHKVAKPAVVDVMPVEVLLDRDELLSPVGVGVGEVSVRVRGAAEQFVRVGQIIRLAPRR